MSDGKYVWLILLGALLIVGFLRLALAKVAYNDYKCAWTHCVRVK